MMSNEMRAKQFMPFAALKGYDEALRAKEHVKIPKAELSEDAADMMDITIRQISEGDIISVVYYNGDGYEKRTGVATLIDLEKRVIKIVNTVIRADDIAEITAEGDSIWTKI